VQGSNEPRCPTKTFGRDCDNASHGNGVTTLSFALSGLASSIFHKLTATTMSAQNITSEDVSSAPMEMEYRELPFPPVTKQHILNCSYHNWHPKSVVSRRTISCAL